MIIDSLHNEHEKIAVLTHFSPLIVCLFANPSSQRYKPLLQTPELSNQTEDVDCLDFLTDITSTDSPDGQGFSLTFNFSPNPYFTNTTLTKTYEVPNLLTEDEPILQKVTGRTSNWKPGQWLTHKETSKKQRKKSGPQAGQIRTVKKLERTDSFFHFFTPPKMPSLGDIIDEEEADAMEEMFDHDYDIAQAFRGSIIPKAVLWFTGEAMEEDMDGMIDEEMMAEMMEQQQQGGGGFNFGGGGGGAAGDEAGSNPFPPAAPGDGENPECKQN